MILPLAILMAGGLFLVFMVHLTNRLEGEEIFPFWFCSMAVMFFGFLGVAIFLPLAGCNGIMLFGSVMSVAVSVIGAAGIAKTLPPL